jgi:hypothetical protein
MQTNDAATYDREPDKTDFFGFNVIFLFGNFLHKIAIAGHQPLKYTGGQNQTFK